MRIGTLVTSKQPGASDKIGVSIERDIQKVREALLWKTLNEHLEKVKATKGQ